MSFGGSRGSNPQDAAIAAVASVVVPKLKDLQVQLQTLVQQGQLSPQQYDTFLQDISAYDNMPSTPEGRNDQLKALTDLNDIIDAPGLNAIDKAKLSQTRAASAQAEQGQRQAILTNAQERGVGGSGLELQSQLLNSQEAANRESAAGTQVAADAATARQAAIEKMMSGGNSLAAQDFSQASTKAAAQNAINQFNTAQKTNTNVANVGTANAAQEKNLAEKQRVADTNAAIKNHEAEANAAAAETDFQNRFSKASGTAGQYNNQSNLQMAQSGRQEQNIMGGVGTVAGMAAMALSDENAKEDIHPVDASKILDALTGYTYKYKHPEKHGEGKQVGVMAQDVEKVLPQAVSEDAEGLKRIDTSKLSGPILAALSNIHERLKTVEGSNMATQEEVLQHLRAMDPGASEEQLQQHVQNIASGADPVMAQRVATNMFSDAKRKELLGQAEEAQNSTTGKISDALAALSTWGSGRSSVEAGRANREARYAHAKEGLTEFDKARERALNEAKGNTEALKTKRSMTAEDVAAGRANTTFGQSQEDRLTKNANEAEKTKQEKTVFGQQQTEFQKKVEDDRKQRDPNSQESEMMRQAMAAMPGVDSSKLAGKSAYDINLIRGVMTDAQKTKFDQERVRAAEKLSQIHEKEAVQERTYQHNKDEEAKAAAVTAKAVLDKTEEEQIRAIDNEAARLKAIKDSAKGVYTGWGAETGNAVRDKFGLENEGFKALNAQIKAVPDSNRSIRGYTPMEIPLNNGPEALNKSVDTSLKILEDRRANILGLAKKTGKNVSAFEPTTEQQQAPAANKPAWAK